MQNRIQIFREKVNRAFRVQFHLYGFDTTFSALGRHHSGIVWHAFHYA